jgi:hypothetical protein
MKRRLKERKKERETYSYDGLIFWRKSNERKRRNNEACNDGVMKKRREEEEEEGGRKKTKKTSDVNHLTFPVLILFGRRRSPCPSDGSSRYLLIFSYSVLIPSIFCSVENEVTFNAAYATIMERAEEKPGSYEKKKRKLICDAVCHYLTMAAAYACRYSIGDR